MTSTIGATRVFDRTLIENTDEVDRKYTGLSYRTPSASVTYYYADRDAFRTETMWRTDLQLNVSYRPSGLQRGVHWDLGPQFGQAIGKDAYTLPRSVQFAVGLRF